MHLIRIGDIYIPQIWIHRIQLALWKLDISNSFHRPSFIIYISIIEWNGGEKQQCIRNVIENEYIIWTEMIMCSKWIHFFFFFYIETFMQSLIKGASMTFCQAKLGPGSLCSNQVKSVIDRISALFLELPHHIAHTVSFFLFLNKSSSE